MHHLLAHIIAPDNRVSECVPKVNHPIVSGRYKLRLCWGRRQGPDVRHVAHHDLLEVEVEVSCEDGVLGGAQEQLAASALAESSDAAQVFRQLSFHPCLTVQCVKLHNPTVLSPASDDAAVLEDTDGEDRAVVHLPHHLGDSVVAPAPDEDVAVRVARDNVPSGGECKAGDIPEICIKFSIQKNLNRKAYFGLSRASKMPVFRERVKLVGSSCQKFTKPCVFPQIKDFHSNTQKICDNSCNLSNSDDCPALKRVELRGYDGLGAALCLSDLVPSVSPRPVPHLSGENKVTILCLPIS